MKPLQARLGHELGLTAAGIIASTAAGFQISKEAPVESWTFHHAGVSMAAPYHGGPGAAGCVCEEGPRPGAEPQFLHDTLA